MADYSEMDLVADDYFVVWAPCACRGDPECECVDGRKIVDNVDLYPLLAGIAAAGALTLSWVHGWNAALMADDAWQPGCGREAPR